MKALRWETIPARILDVDDAEAEILALSDNEGQEGLSDYERGKHYARIMARHHGMSQRSLASRVGVSPNSVGRCLALTTLPKDCLNFLDKHPRLLGSKLALDFAALGTEHSALLLEALVKIDQESISQEQALRWLSQRISEANQSAPKQPKTRVEAVRFAGGQDGELVIGKSDIRIKVPKGVDMASLERAIKLALSNAE